VFCNVREGLTWCVAVCCSVLQCVAVCCSVMSRMSQVSILQCSRGTYVVCCSVMQCVAVCCSVLQCVIQCYMSWTSHVGVFATSKRDSSIVLQCVAACCSVLQYHVTNESNSCFAMFERDLNSVLQCVAVCCDMLQCVAMCCSVKSRMRPVRVLQCSRGT